MAIFHNPRDQHRISVLGYHLMGTGGGSGLATLFRDAFHGDSGEEYQDITAEKSDPLVPKPRYICINMMRECPEQFRIKTDIVPGRPCYVYRIVCGVNKSRVKVQ